MTLRNMLFFQISSMVLGLLNPLQIFLQLYLIELLGLLTGLVRFKVQHVTYTGLLAGFYMQVFFTNLSLMEFQVRYLALFLLFAVIDGFKWLWMGSLHKNTQLMLEFLKAPFLKASFLVLHFSYSTLITFLILSVMLLFMLMMLLSILNVTRHLITRKNLNQLLKLNLMYQTLNWGKKWLFNFNAGKTQLVSFDQSNNTGSIDVKMDGSVLETKPSFNNLGLTFPFILNWGCYIISIAKTACKKNGALIHSMKFLSPEVVLYLYKSIIRSCMEYCCHIWAGAPSCYLEYYTSYKNEYAGLLVLHLLLVLNPWLIVEIWPA